jgi:hypothetical protein
MEFLAGTAGTFVAAAVASTALGYNIRKDASSSAFHVDLATGGLGANCWPEGWPENWMEKARSLRVDGAWWTHKPDWPMRKRLRKIKQTLNAEEADQEEDDEDNGAYSCFFPFRIQWDQLKLDLEFTDKRLSAEAAQLEKQRVDFKIKYQKAHDRYTKELARAMIARSVGSTSSCIGLRRTRYAVPTPGNRRCASTRTANSRPPMGNSMRGSAIRRYQVRAPHPRRRRRRVASRRLGRHTERAACSLTSLTWRRGLM